MKKIKTFWGLCSLTSTGELTAFPRPSAAILHAFGTPVFCFPKNRCFHIFPVLSPVDTICAISLAHVNNTIQAYIHCDTLINFEALEAKCKSGEQYQLLKQTVWNGYPRTQHLTHPKICEYWELTNHLTTNDNTVTLDQFIIIPGQLQNSILQNLHSAYHDTVNIQESQLHTKCMCYTSELFIQCSKPTKETASFHNTQSGHLELKRHSFLTKAGRFSGWICLYHFKKRTTTANNLSGDFRTLFMNHSAPE